MWQRIVYLKSQYNLIELFHDPETGHLRLDLNLCTQFHSADEHRYHELAIHSAYVIAGKEPKKVLILGGGDGLACREALKFAEKVIVVDIDSDVTDLAKKHPLVSALNCYAFNDERVKIYNKDAYYWVRECRKHKFDIVFADYPDPTSPSLSKLFSLEHYEEIKRILKPHGVLVVQSGGALMFPVMAVIGAKLRKLFKWVVPLKVEMLSGIQGFWFATNIDKIEPKWERLNNIETKAFDKQMFLSATSWSKDLKEALKKGNAEEDAYDAYVYSLCWIKHLKVSVGG